MSITAAKKQSVIKQYAKTKNDTGSANVQIAILTERINSLTEHLKTHEKDTISRKGLLGLVARRRRLLNYLKSTDESTYADLIGKLGLRK